MMLLHHMIFLKEMIGLHTSLHSVFGFFFVFTAWSYRAFKGLLINNQMLPYSAFKKIEGCPVSWALYYYRTLHNITQYYTIAHNAKNFKNCQHKNSWNDEWKLSKFSIHDIKVWYHIAPSSWSTLFAISICCHNHAITPHHVTHNQSVFFQVICEGFKDECQ